MLRALREGGIPHGVSTFRPVDNPDLEFVAAESLVLAQLYWYGEEGWEPELLPWWRRLCRDSGSVLELGANVGYFTVQAARAAPGVRHVAVEPHPYSLEICRANLALNPVTSVELVGAAAVADPTVPIARLLVPADQLATPTVAFLPSDTELPGRHDPRRHDRVRRSGDRRPGTPGRRGPGRNSTSRARSTRCWRPAWTFCGSDGRPSSSRSSPAPRGCGGCSQTCAGGTATGATPRRATSSSSSSRRGWRPCG